MEYISRRVSQIVSELFDQDSVVRLDRPEAQFGDAATNVALQLAKPLGKNPREIAEQIAEMLREDSSFQDVAVAGPGFINIRLTDEALLKLAQKPLAQSLSTREVVIETNNPNPFKPMHIGHAFNAILADSIANLLDAGGAITHRVSYHGDVGAHVGKSMYRLLQFCEGNPDKLRDVPAQERNAFMSQMYAEGATAYSQDEAAKRHIDELTSQSFTRDDPVYDAIYTRVLGWSFEEIDRNVMQLGNKPIEKRYLESQADQSGVDIVKAHTPEVFIESNGAYVFEGSKHGSFDNVFVASTGRGLYAARDLGLMQLKYHDYPLATTSYIVTAEEQRDYFRGVIAAAGLCQPELGEMTQNMSTGTVKLSTGKMSSRTGDVVTIDWLFDRVREALVTRGGEPTDAIVAGALRYQFLKVRLGGDVVFDVNEAVSITGNSGPYLQYAHARACSILAKSSISSTQTATYDETERVLLRKIGEYNEVLEKAVEELLPHSICNYLYELAQEFNRFYEKSRIIGDEREAVRIGLVLLYRDTLARGLSVLGIPAPESM